MVQTLVGDITDDYIRALLDEIEQVTGRPLSAHQKIRLFDYLGIAMRNEMTGKFQGLNAAGFYKGSMLKTKVEKFDHTSVGDLIQNLCTDANINPEFVRPKMLYKAISDIWNQKSKLRKQPKIWL